MPMYEFKCGDCGHRFEELVFSANAPVDKIACPQCGSHNSEKLISAAAISGASGHSGGSCGPLPSGGFG